MKAETFFSISHGKYTAEISTTGAALAALKFEASDLIEPRTHPRYFSGELLAPWPNRIKDGKYQYRGHDFQLSVNEINRNNALHGLVFDKDWSVITHEKDRIILQIIVDEQEKYPGILELEISYELDELGLLSTLTATNRGASQLPYGASTHPYISVPGLDSVNDFKLGFGANKVLLTDEQRLLPTELVDIDTTNFDFRTPRAIGDLFIDHAFLQDPELPREVSVTSRDGIGILISFNESAKWVQIHTADRSGGADSRKVLAVEPMTCPPDAFNSGIDLIELLPEQSHQLIWRIQIK
jgi:aldose 1-epimerase